MRRRECSSTQVQSEKLPDIRQVWEAFKVPAVQIDMFRVLAILML
jgi:hypothetical protein